MPWDNAGETVVGGTGEVYTAAIGATLPTTAASSLSPATWIGAGYHTEDGVSVNKGLEIVEHRAWQSKHPIRRERDTEDFAVSFGLVQWNEETLPFAFGGGEVTIVSSGQYKYTPAGDTEDLDERSMVVDVVDGSKKLRIVIPRGTVVDGVESQFARNQLSALPVTFRALEPETGGDAWYLLTNSSDFFGGS